MRDTVEQSVACLRPKRFMQGNGAKLLKLRVEYPKQFGMCVLLLPQLKSGFSVTALGGFVIIYKIQHRGHQSFRLNLLLSNTANARFQRLRAAIGQKFGSRRFIFEFSLKVWDG